MDSQTVEVSNVQVEGVLRESAALAAGLKKARRVRLLLFLVILVFLGASGWVAYGKANDFASEKNLKLLGTTVSLRLEKKQDHYMKELEKLVNKLSPPLTKAFQEQAKKDTPLFLKAMEKERQPFLDSIQDQFSKRLNKRLEALQPRYEALLKKEFPAFKDEKLQSRMAENLTQAVEKLLKKYYVDELHEHILLLFSTWDTFPPAAAPGRGAPPLEDQFLDALVELLIYRLTHHQPAPFEE
jgi:hypothetical protein